MASFGSYKTSKMTAGTTDRCRIETDSPHPLGKVEINWLDDGLVRIAFPNAPELHLTKAYLEGDGNTSILAVIPAGTS